MGGGRPPAERDGDLLGQIVGGTALGVNKDFGEGGEEHVVARGEHGEDEVHDANVGADAHDQHLRTGVKDVA